jgi:type IV secretory pathway TrbD component
MGLNREDQRRRKMVLTSGRLANLIIVELDSWKAAKAKGTCEN